MATAKRARTTKPKAPKSAPAPEVAKVTTQAVDLQDVIRTRAFEFFEQRGYQHGHDFDDWLRAEAEVLSHFGARTA